jgi:hypothetical protein
MHIVTQCNGFSTLLTRGDSIYLRLEFHRRLSLLAPMFGILQGLKIFARTCQAGQHTQT